jgi:hypothetical protein
MGEVLIEHQPVHRGDQLVQEKLQAFDLYLGVDLEGMVHPLLKIL